MDYSSSNGHMHGGIFQGNLQQQGLQQPLQQQQRNALSGMSNDDYQQIMMSNIGSVMPSRQSIASFMHNPQDMLCLGGSTNAIFDQSQTLKNSNSSAFLQNNQQQQMFLNHNALFQQQQQLAKAAQQQPPQSNDSNNTSYQNAIFQQQRQQMQQQHELQRQQLKLQQHERLEQHQKEVQQNKRPPPGTVVSNVISSSIQQPQMSSFQQPPQQHKSQHKVHQQPTTTLSAPIPPPTTTKTRVSPENVSINGAFDDGDPFDFPDHFADSIDDDLFSDLHPFQMEYKKPKDPTAPEPTRSISLPTTELSSSPIVPMQIAASAPLLSSRNNNNNKAPPISVSSSSFILQPLVGAVHKAVPPPAPSLLHQACYLYPTTLAVVNSALGVETNNVRRRVPTPAASIVAGSNNKKRKHESFSLPLHITLDKEGSKDVVAALTKAGPDVVAMTDGPDACTAVSVALYKNCSVETISLLVKANPMALKEVDRHQNTSLHVGCSKGASLEVMKLLYVTYPKALTMKNFHGQNPLNVAQRTTVCPLNVIDFFQSLVDEALERKASHLLDSDDDRLV
mmetsp:Transcript_3303/g.5397  ORF Transcript_3303/g.5397 Transcript_3303/m.5397 type:complete len:564 (+) Transcript_3303:299-1990(+)|eukprot:CAMPEP_0119004024 /NCGR_PEP_ID=MMETSP1176-20130426/902_1 /TAXON_ID=265551 /ORGANISM="Synedropsis recta cf, Strain CCMP1620" /LENGTH=563 /DNA_ID=CAMNT_0006955683 /DNA_START=264 /DNA_END=1955 /DNA_ORIENTATION=-